MAMAAERRWRAFALAGGSVFFVLYLYAIGDLVIDGRAAWMIMVADLSPAHWTRARSLFLYEAMALVEAGWLVWLVSPVNLLITALLASLTAGNIHGILTLRAAPQQCGAGGRYGSLGGAMPALLAGSACCAPSLLLILGIPGLGVFASLFQWLVPVSFVLLLLSRWWQRRMGAPTFWR